MDKLAKGMIKPFNGEGDLVAWLKKLKLVAELLKISDLASFIPLFLEGDALALYMEMSEVEQQDEGMIEKRLREAFTEGPFEAYEKLKEFKWTGESVDVYANSIKRLAGLAGYVGRGLDQTAKLAFVTGFPDGISMSLQQLPGINTMEIADLIPTARVLTRTRGRNSGTVGAVACSKEPTDKHAMGSSSTIRCYRCQGPHRLRECKVPPRGRTMCYKCEKFGHIARYCPLNQGNDQGEAFAPAAAPSTE